MINIESPAKPATDDTDYNSLEELADSKVFMIGRAGD